MLGQGSRHDEWERISRYSAPGMAEARERQSRRWVKIMFVLFRQTTIVGTTEIAGEHIASVAPRRADIRGVQKASRIADIGVEAL